MHALYRVSLLQHVVLLQACCHGCRIAHTAVTHGRGCRTLRVPDKRDLQIGSTGSSFHGPHPNRHGVSSAHGILGFLQVIAKGARSLQFNQVHAASIHGSDKLVQRRGFWNKIPTGCWRWRCWLIGKATAPVTKIGGYDSEYFRPGHNGCQLSPNGLFASARQGAAHDGQYRYLFLVTVLANFGQIRVLQFPRMLLLVDSLRHDGKVAAELENFLSERVIDRERSQGRFQVRGGRHGAC